MMRKEAMMPGHTWAKLSETDCKIWDQLSDDVKMAILNARSQLKLRPQSKPPPRRLDKRLVSLHDVIQACMSASHDRHRGGFSRCGCYGQRDASVRG